MDANKWEQLAEKCLDSALALLEKETTPTVATVEAVRGLAKTAIAISKVGCDSPIGPGAKYVPVFREGRVHIEKRE